jgi:hypothetical protein
VFDVFDEEVAVFGGFGEAEEDEEDGLGEGGGACVYDMSHNDILGRQGGFVKSERMVTSR